MPHYVRKIPVFANLVDAISLRSKTDLKVLSAASRLPLQESSGLYSTTPGLPCAHELGNLCEKVPNGLGCIAHHCRLTIQQADDFFCCPKVEPKMSQRLTPYPICEQFRLHHQL